MQGIVAFILLLIAQDGGAAAEGNGGIAQLLFGSPLIMFAMIGILFYLMLIRPERRKRQDMVRMLENLKKNDRVVTIGGIFGTVVNVQKDAEDVTIRVDENSNIRVRVLRSAISRIVTSEESSSKKSAEKDAS